MDTDALDQCDHTIELNPHFSLAYLTLGFIQEQRKDFDESAAAFQRAIHLSPQTPRMHAALARTLALSGTGSIAASSLVTDTGTFNIANTTSGASIQSLTGTGSVALGGQTLTLTNAANTFSGVIGGTGGLTLAGGTETLAGASGALRSRPISSRT